jgi:hypothetical protein
MAPRPFFGPVTTRQQSEEEQKKLPDAWCRTSAVLMGILDFAARVVATPAQAPHHP